MRHAVVPYGLGGSGKTDIVSGAAVRCPHAGVCPRRLCIEAQLGDQTGEGEAAIALYGDGRMRPCSRLTTADDDALLRQDLTRLAGAIPGLTSQSQQARVVLAEVIVLMRRLPPRPRVGTQMRWCLECRVFHLDSDFMGTTPPSLRSPLNRWGLGGGAPGGSLPTWLPRSIRSRFPPFLTCH